MSRCTGPPASTFRAPYLANILKRFLFSEEEDDEEEEEEAEEEEEEERLNFWYWTCLELAM